MKNAIYGMGCTGCENCDTIMDKKKGTLKCRSNGCKPCKRVLIVQDELDELLEFATW